MNQATLSMNVFEETLAWARSLNLQIQSHSQVNSTNDWAKSEAFDDPNDLKIYLADQQTHGRGRGKNQWSNSGPGQALLVTFSMPLTQAPQPIAGPLMGLAVYRALTSVYANIAFSIKPPNDIYFQNKKILGILVETLQQGRKFQIIVGLGMNVFSAPHSESNAGSLIEAVPTISKQSWYEFLNQLYRQILAFSKDVQNSLLSPDLCQEILFAINKFPNKKAPYLSVSSQGDLVSTEGKTSWQDL